MQNDLEQGKSKDLVVVGLELLDEVQQMWKAGNAKRIRIKFGDRVVKEFPVAFTAVATLIIGVAAVLISKSSIEVVSEERSEE